MKKIISLFVFALMTLVTSAQQKGEDYIIRKADGKMFWMRGKERIRMMIDVPLKNGSVVNYKGIVKAKDGQITQLEKGDKILMDGTIVRSKRKS